jgi:hypothetical protein
LSVCLEPAQLAETQGAEMDLGHYLDAMDRLQGVVDFLSRSAPHPYDRHAHHYQQMLDVIGASLVEWGHPSLTEEAQARLFAASESADLAHVSVEQALKFVKVAIDILHPRMPTPKSLPLNATLDEGQLSMPNRHP